MPELIRIYFLIGFPWCLWQIGRLKLASIKNLNVRLHQILYSIKLALVYNNQDLKMNNIRVETQNFIYNIVLPAKKLWDISELEGHYCYEMKDGKKFFFKRRQFPNLKEIQQEAAKTVLGHTTESLKNQLLISQAGLSKYIMRYHSMIISYPFACFVHPPFLDNLSNFIKKPLCSEEKVDLMVSIARGVEDLYAKNICLRTLRPSTIILMDDPEEKYSIVFSDVRNIGSIEKEKKFVMSEIKQTNPYVAPELVHEGNLTLSCDIWSLGLVYYQIFFNKRINFLHLEQTGTVEYPIGCSKWVQNFLQKMINKEHKNRYNIKDIIRFLKNANLCSKLSKICLC